jgi:hypothetical protein
MKAPAIVAPEPGTGASSDAGRNDIATAHDAHAEARDRTLYEAASEAAALAALFRQFWEAGGRNSVEFDGAIRGALLRIESLCTTVCVLQADHWRDNVAEEYRVVFGKPLEVAHV